LTFLAKVNGENRYSDDENIRWFADSGATDHFINDDRHFSSEITLKNPIKICVAKTGEALEQCSTTSVPQHTGMQLGKH
jgi:hypothetical protein